jgi:2-polyprenyl-6-methoxyphenol hydroxylase-like FAD-dependent oxidoreductase
LWSIVDVSEHNPYPTQLRQKYKTANFMTGLLPTGRTPLATDKELVSFFWSIPVDYFSTWISADKSFDEWKNQVVDLWAETQFVVDQLTSKSDLAFATYNDAVMTQWHDKRVVYIGDAAHYMSPQLGQGANLALIDSYVLSQSLLRNQNIETALAHYTDSRKGNIRFYQNMSRLMTPFYQSDNALYGWLRDVFSWPVTQVPWVKEQMLATLTGEKTGWLSKQPIK